MSYTRYIAHSNEPPVDLQAVKHDLQNALIANVQRVHRHKLWKPSVYVGEAGPILMDWRLSALVPELKLPSSRRDVTSLQDSSIAVPHSGSITSFLETSVGHAALILYDKLRAYGEGGADRKEDKLLESCTRVIYGAIQTALREPIDDGGCEVLYGRAGLLYALLLLRSDFAPSMPGLESGEDSGEPLLRGTAQLFSDANLKALVDDIVKRGRVGASVYKEELESDDQQRAPPLMWSWHGKRYLGGAHGVAGILQMLLSAPTRAISPYWPDILGTVEWLLAIQAPSGNWPSKAGRHMYYAVGGSATSRATRRVSLEDGDELVQWCHGAPGVLILLSSLLSRVSHSSTLTVSSSLRDSIIAALKRGGELVYTRGLLKKGVGLCHGVAGSVYTLLAISDVLDNLSDPSPYWLARAVHLAQLATNYQVLERKGEMGVPDEPYSLYEGVGGMCCAWAEVLARLDTSSEGKQTSRQRHRGMPGYNDLSVR